MKYEFYSSLALVTSVVIYLLAMIAHAAEWAAARRIGVQAPVGGPALVGAGARALDRPGAVGPPGFGSDAGSRGEVTSDSAGNDLPGRGADGDPSRRVEAFGRIGVSLTLIAFGLSGVGVVSRGIAAGRAPWGNMFEFTTSAMVFIVAVYLVMVFKADMRWLGLPVTLLAAVGNGLAVTVFYVAVAPLVPALHSVWFVIHIVAAAVAGAAFNVGGIASILYLVKKRAEDRGAVSGYLARLPSTARIDLLTYRFHAFAFPLWTFTVAAGAIWAEYAWGRYWGWDPKETWALVTWVIYACYLHARSTAGWKGTKAAVIAIIGLASFWFNFIGINLLVSGLHSYAGV
ncbi:MAG TPA: c-type cytochrome biogenesis protein CcsB [Propionibacteriaceae bacterium]|nr:c-type cytochrome biogenesis protein CcsB [Propionibacteriaceae bacterium]